MNNSAWRNGRKGRKWTIRAAMAAATLAACVVPAVDSGRASAAVAAVGGPCGYHLGPPSVSGAAGTFGFEVPVYPANPHQVCSVTVTVQASIAPAAGGRYTNVAGSPSTRTVTFAFTGSPLPLGVLWLWSPHCADPAAPGVFAMTSGGQSSSIPLAAMSCAGFAGASSLSFARLDPADTNTVVGMAATTTGQGYWTVTASGVVQGKGDAAVSGFLPVLNRPAVGVVADPLAPGYWVVASDGGVFTFGAAGFHGSLGSVRLNAPVVGMAATPDGGGYWLVAADGGVFTFGDAGFHGSLGSVRLNAPVVGMAATPDGGGYWLVAADGGVFTFGDAGFHGSLGSVRLNAPVVGMAATPHGGGYWLAAYDGGVFTFGDAPFEGSAGSLPLAAPVFGMSRTPSGHGYWLVAGDGGIFTYGDAGFFGATSLLP